VKLNLAYCHSSPRLEYGFQLCGQIFGDLVDSIPLGGSWIIWWATERAWGKFS
jgi:hypothetical protein